MKYIKNFEALDAEFYNEIPCALYNKEKKELIGLFNTRSLASKYLLGDKDSRKISTIIKRKSVLYAKRNLLNVDVVIRNLNELQKKELGNQVFVIRPDYPSPIGFGKKSIPDGAIHKGLGKKDLNIIKKDKEENFSPIKLPNLPKKRNI